MRLLATYPTLLMSLKARGFVWVISRMTTWNSTGSEQGRWLQKNRKTADQRKLEP